MDLLRALAILTLACLTSVSAFAENYPSKPVKIIVSTSAGGVTDLAARILGAYITTKTGQPVVIDNRPGASGNIAMEAVAKAPPDGYTLGVANTGNIVINPFLMRHMPYDPLTELVPVGPIGDHTAIWRRVVDDTCIALCAELIGAMEAANHLAVEYAKARVQFDRPIATFQVINPKADETIYDPGCGLDNIHMSWGHDEYVYHVVKDYLPEEALYMLRYHSFYPWHKEGEYTHLTNEKDREMLKWVRAFNRYDLYSKGAPRPKADELMPYYRELVDEFLPEPLRW